MTVLGGIKAIVELLRYDYLRGDEELVLNIHEMFGILDC